MTLPNEHLPLPCSLREVVSRRFTHPQPGHGENTLDTGRLVTFLKDAVGADEAPLMVVRRRTADERDPATNPAALRAEQAAIIEWVTLAFDHWQRDFPVEAPLADTLRRLLPLAIAVALTDHSFHTPGSHPLHALLDRLQHNAVGWQARLERAGQMLEQRVQRAVDRALGWFEDHNTDFTAVTEELEDAARRDQDRAARMVHRLEETEEAAAKTRHARREAAGVINRGLASCELPMAIGEFLKGPWYDSLQLVALRHGTESHEWRESSRITEQLLQSVQPTEGGRDQSSGTLRRLSGELRHWLLSLQHDSAAADDAIGLVEYVHLRMSHGQDLGHTHIRPLPVPGEQAGESGGDDPAMVLETGQWYLLEDGEGELRAQLSLQLEEGRHLLFTNAVGLKAFDLDRASFLEQLRNKAVRHLPAEDSFSLSLSHAAGIDDEHKLRALIEPGYRPPEPATEDGPGPALEAGLEPATDGEPEPAPVGPEPATDGEPEPAPVAGPEPATDGEPGPASAAGSPAAADAGAQPAPGAGPGPLTAPLADTPEQASPTPAEAEPTFDAPPVPAAEPAPPAAAATSAPPPPAGERAPAIPKAGSERHAGTAEAELPSLELELVGENDGRRGTAPAPEARPAAPAPHAQPAAPARPRRAPPGPAMDVPMGAWLGFHDGETPIMAKLAVYDPRRDNYIFVNRRGIALRELSRGELLSLIDEGLVDILETRSYFRDEVERARERRDD